MNLRNNLRNVSRSLVTDTRGANMVEYILLVGVVALLCITAFTQFGGSIQTKIAKQGGAVEDIGGK